MTTTAILTAAGSGSRLGASVPKALVEIDGSPMVLIAAQNLFQSGVVDELVITVPPGYMDQFTDALDSIEQPITFVIGGETRQKSIEKAIAQLNPGCTKVLVHDAARPFAPPELVAKVANAVHGATKAVIPALPVTDTIKSVISCPAADLPNEANQPSPTVILRTRLEEPGSAESTNIRHEIVESTLNRASLRAVQTPQGFDRQTLANAYRYAIVHPEIAATDDAELVEAMGAEVQVIPGDVAALKITTPTDLRVATALFTGSIPPPSFCGKASFGGSPADRNAERRISNS